MRTHKLCCGTNRLRIALSGVMLASISSNGCSTVAVSGTRQQLGQMQKLLHDVNLSQVYKLAIDVYNGVPPQLFQVTEILGETKGSGSANVTIANQLASAVRTETYTGVLNSGLEGSSSFKITAVIGNSAPVKQYDPDQGYGKESDLRFKYVPGSDPYKVMITALWSWNLATDPAPSGWPRTLQERQESEALQRQLINGEFLLGNPYAPPEFGQNDPGVRETLQRLETFGLVRMNARAGEDPSISPESAPNDSARLHSPQYDWHTAETQAKKLPTLADVRSEYGDRVQDVRRIDENTVMYFVRSDLLRFSECPPEKGPTHICIEHPGTEFTKKGYYYVLKKDALRFFAVATQVMHSVDPAALPTGGASFDQALQRLRTGM